MTIWHMRITCCVPKATNTNSEYYLLIAFPRQQWLFKHASMLRLYVHCLCCLLYHFRVSFITSLNTVALSHRRPASTVTCLVTAAVLGSVTKGGFVLFLWFITLR